MKFSALALAAASATSSAYAFTSPAARSSSSALFSSTAATAEETKVEMPSAPLPLNEVAIVRYGDSSEEEGKTIRIEPGRYAEGVQSKALPFLKRPNKLDGSHAGDNGFDPLGLTEQLDLYTMQEAEVRHARLAMLAVIGWPLSELLAPEWMLQQNGCAPSVLNGFNPVSFIATLSAFAGLGFLEYQTSLRMGRDNKLGRIHDEDMRDVWKYGVAGDYNFDPLNLYNSAGDDAYARKGMRDVEISHGRMAMLGITYFAAWEFLTKHPIVENSMFFHPNLLLPALTAGYFGFNAIYKVESNDQYVLQISKTSEGEAILENLKIWLPSPPTPEQQEQMAEKMSDAAAFAKSAAEKLSAGYEKASEGYLEYSTRNIEGDKN